MRPILHQRAFTIPSTKNPFSFAASSYLVKVHAGLLPIFAEDPEHPLMDDAKPEPVVEKIMKPKRNVRFAPFANPVLFSLREVGNYQILKEQRLVNIKTSRLRSHDLCLAALATDDLKNEASWNLLKRVWAEKHSRNEHGTTRDEIDDILDIICGSNDAMDISSQLHELVKYGRFVKLDQKLPMVHNMDYVIQWPETFTIEQLLKISKYTQAMQKEDGLYEFPLSKCVREALRRCSFPYKKFVRHAGCEKAAAEDIASLTGILALLCKNFRADMAVTGQHRTDPLRKGPWKDTLKTCLHRNCFGLYSRHRQSTVEPEDQLHLTQVPEMICKIAKFLSLHGVKAVSSLPKSSVVSMAANIHAAFDEIITSESNWLVAELATSLVDLAKAVCTVGLGYEAPKGTIFAALKILSDSR
ncbi:hypothetical protein Ndes2437A_g06343 [Nannochloris sp. 'desiccata']